MDADGDPYPRNPTLRAIAARPRRAVLTTLLDGDSLLTEPELAARLVAGRSDSAGAVGPTPAVGSHRKPLVHTHLPVLTAVGLVDRNRARGTVQLGAHPALDDPRFRRLLDMDAEDLDPVLMALSHEHRRIVLIALKRTRAPAGLSELAEEIRRQDAEVSGRMPPATDDVLVLLYHGHLPALADMGFVEHDAGTERAAYAGHPTLDRVLEIIYEPNERIADQFDQFLGDLHDSYRRATAGAVEPFGWPHFWRMPHHG